MFMKLSPFFMLVVILGVFCGTGAVPASETDDGPAAIRGSHSAATTCVQCHGTEPIPPDAAGLVAPVPELCSTCHNEYASLQGWVHGPAATGDCTFCHDSHQSEYSSLLTKPIPELCHDCHTAETLRLVVGHSDDSYRHCDTCHESHAGTNRKLLKENFLSSEAGDAYRDEMTYRQPQYTFVDRRASLAGLRGVRIMPSVERRDLLTHYGVTAEAVQGEVERRLREENVTLLSDEGQAAGQPGLYVYLRLVELHFPGYSDEVCAVVGNSRHVLAADGGIGLSAERCGAKDLSRQHLGHQCRRGLGNPAGSGRAQQCHRSPHGQVLRRLSGGQSHRQPIGAWAGLPGKP